MSCRAIIKPKTDEECEWDILAAECKDSDVCSYQYRFGDLTPSQSCRLTQKLPPTLDTIIQSYDALKSQNPQLGITGVLENEAQRGFLCALSLLGLENLVLEQAFAQIQSAVEQSYLSTNDGYWIRDDPYRSKFMSYAVPVADLFEVLNEIIQNFNLNSPIEFRLVDLKDQAVLQPGDKRNGVWASIEVLSITGPSSPNSEVWREAFMRIEDIFIRSKGFPHPGKIFGMGRDGNGIPEPFINITVPMFNYTSRKKFEEYRKAHDPINLFYGGYAAKQLVNT